MIKKYPHLFFNPVKNVSVKIIITGGTNMDDVEKGWRCSRKNSVLPTTKIKKLKIIKVTINCVLFKKILTY